MKRREEEAENNSEFRDQITLGPAREGLHNNWLEARDQAFKELDKAWTPFTNIDQLNREQLENARNILTEIVQGLAVVGTEHDSYIKTLGAVERRLQG